MREKERGKGGRSHKTLPGTIFSNVRKVKEELLVKGMRKRSTSSQDNQSHNSQLSQTHSSQSNSSTPIQSHKKKPNKRDREKKELKL